LLKTIYIVALSTTPVTVVYAVMLERGDIRSIVLEEAKCQKD